MKRIFCLLLVALSLFEMVSGGFVLASDECDHSFSVSSEEGYACSGMCVEYSCIYCGDTYYEDIPATEEHSYELIGKDGFACSGMYTEYSCIYCGDTYYEDVSATEEHSYELISEEGYACSGMCVEYSCIYCGDTYYEDIPATEEHSYELIGKDGFACSGMYTEYSCIYCGDTYYEDVSATGEHNYELISEDGYACSGKYVEYSCIYCGDTYYEDMPATEEHVYEQVSEEGYSCSGICLEYSCIFCGETYYEDVPGNGEHSYELTYESGSACGGGYREYSCALCGDSYTEEIPGAGIHSYEVTFEEGSACGGTYVEYTCTVCGDFYYEEIPASIEHDYQETGRGGSTCEGFWIDYECSYCEDGYSDYLDATTEHDYQISEQSTSEIQYACVHCGDSYTVELEMEGYIRNSFIEASIRNDGFFTMGTVSGDPNNPLDDNELLLYGHPGSDTSRTLIRIDGKDYFFEDHTTDIWFSETRNQCVVKAVIDEIEVQQILTLETNPFTGIQDIISIRYRYTNKSSTSKAVGIRIMLDTMLGSNDGAPFRVDGQAITSEIEFSGENIPQYWQSFDSLAEPTVIASGFFFFSEAERPDKVQFASWAEIFDSLWNYAIESDRAVTGDSAVATYFFPEAVAPGSSSSVVTYYGISGFSKDNSDVDGDLAVRVTAPTVLHGSDIGEYENNPFNVNVYLSNLSDAPISDLIVVLSLSEAPQLMVSDEQATTVEIGDFPAGATQNLQWVFEATPQLSPVTVQYYLRFYSGSKLIKTMPLSLKLEEADTTVISSTPLQPVDYLALADLVYGDMTEGKTVKEILANKWDEKYKGKNFTYGQLYHNLQSWEVLFVEFNTDTGFYAAAFTNGKGNAVIAYRGSESLLKIFSSVDAWNDWMKNDFPMEILGLATDDLQIQDAFDTYDRLARRTDISNISVTGHSLGGLLGDAVSAYSGCTGITFNAVTALDVPYIYYPILMSRNFTGTNTWTFEDHINRYDIIAGNWDWLDPDTIKNCVKYDCSFSDPVTAHGMKTLLQNDSPRLVGVKERSNVNTVLTRDSFLNSKLTLGTTRADVIRRGSILLTQTVYGGNGDDTVITGTANDILVGGNGSDTLDGGSGNDQYIIYKGSGVKNILDNDGIDRLLLEGFDRSDNIDWKLEGNRMVVRCNGEVIAYLPSGRYKGSVFSVDVGDLSSVIHGFEERKKLLGIFRVGCPVNVNVLDASGNVVATLEDGVPTEIYNEYGSFFVELTEEGEYVKTVYLEEGCSIEIVGQGEGTMDITASIRTENGIEDPYSIEDIQVADSMIAYIEYSSVPVLRIDEDSDGSFDQLHILKEEMENPFEDVRENKYYYKPILWAYYNGITTGKTATTFQPDAPCTRAQIVTFLWRAMGEPEPTTEENPFEDINPGAYYYKAVLWAYENGITTGRTSTIFGPSLECTRAQVVTFLWRTMGEPSVERINPFEDVPDGKYYTQAVLWALDNNITTGKTETTFLPDDSCTRGQIAAFLYRTLAEDQ